MSLTDKKLNIVATAVLKGPVAAVGWGIVSTLIVAPFFYAISTPVVVGMGLLLAGSFGLNVLLENGATKLFNELQEVRRSNIKELLEFMANIEGPSLDDEGKAQTPDSNW